MEARSQRPGLGGEHLPELRRSVSGQQTLRRALWIGFVVGLVAHVSGYLLKVSVTTKLPGLMADLLYTLGWALWTGVVVAVFFQLVPELKARQIKRAADALEAVLRDQTRAGRGPAGGDGRAPSPPSRPD